MKKSYSILYTADLHGWYKLYERLFQIGSKKNIDAIIIGGDILPKNVPIERLLIEQRNFIQKYLIPKLAEFKKQSKNNQKQKPVYLMMGNDDFACNMDLLEKAEEGGLLNLLHNKTHNLTKDINIRGYGYVNLTPFGIKDWEKFDSKKEPNEGANLKGVKSKRISGSSGSCVLTAVDFTKENRKDTIERDLERIAKDASDMQNTVYVIHAPPFGTDLDVTYSSFGYSTKHVGSKAIKQFIERYQPLATLHGHIHESPDITHSYKQKIGKTISIQPGQSEKLQGVIFNVYDIKNSMKAIWKI